MKRNRIAVLVLGLIGMGLSGAVASPEAMRALAIRELREPVPEIALPLSVTAVLRALGAGICRLAPLIFPILGVSTVVSLATLRYVVPYRNEFFAVTLVAFGLAYWNAIARRGRTSRVEWGVLGGSTVAVAGLLPVSIEGRPRLW